MQINELMEKHKKMFMCEGGWILMFTIAIISMRKTINPEKIDILLTKLENGELNEDFINKLWEIEE